MAKKFKYEMDSIPVRYKSILFRSTLEARWAAFWDEMGWEWTYEPFDLNGWIPDFSIKACYPMDSKQKYNPLLVEVKPIYDFDESTGLKMKNANLERYEMLLVGIDPFRGIDEYDKESNCVYKGLGWLYETDLQWGYGWGDAYWTNTPGIAHGEGSFGCRIEGTGGGSDHDLGIMYSSLERKWLNALDVINIERTKMFKSN